MTIKQHIDDMEILVFGRFYYVRFFSGVEEAFVLRFESSYDAVQAAEAISGNAVFINHESNAPQGFSDFVAVASADAESQGEIK